MVVPCHSEPLNLALKTQIEVDEIPTCITQLPTIIANT